jgi:hypothetical protein
MVLKAGSITSDNLAQEGWIRTGPFQERVKKGYILLCRISHKNHKPFIFKLGRLEIKSHELKKIGIK